MRCDTAYEISLELLVQAEMAARCAECGAAFSVDRSGRVWPLDVESPQRVFPPPVPPSASQRTLATVPLKRVRSESRGPEGVRAEVSAREGDAERGDYHLTRESSQVAGASPRRRVVVVTRSPRKQHVRARIVSLPLNFGRVKGADAAPPTARSPCADLSNHPAVFPQESS